MKLIIVGEAAAKREPVRAKPQEKGRRARVSGFGKTCDPHPARQPARWLTRHLVPLGEGKPDGEPRPVTGSAFDLNRSAMLIYRPLDETQAQAGAVSAIAA